MTRVHGGPGPSGPARWDFSTNANACGPCPGVLAKVQAADPTRYPDPAYTALRAALGAFHGVDPDRLVPTASASEAIVLLTAQAVRQGARSAAWPLHAYGDYAHAASAWGLSPPAPPLVSGPAMAAAPGRPADLRWWCDPSSPLGQTVDLAAEPHGRLLTVLDCAYTPLRLTPHAPTRVPEGVWQMWTPNKALGLTGLRGAYLIAPTAADAATLERLGPSWPLGSHAVAMLQAWTDLATQHWLAEARQTLRGWKTQLLATLRAHGWQMLPSDANFLCARPPQTLDPAALAAHGVQLRDATSFGLPGWWRLGVLPPPALAALRAALTAQAPAGACPSPPTVIP